VILDEEAAYLISGLKHATGRNVRIVLAQPSEDPLNWPVWRPELCVGISCMGGVLVAALFPDVEYQYRYSRCLFSMSRFRVLLGGYVLLVTGTSG
jgi:hypothetical protein